MQRSLNDPNEPFLNEKKTTAPGALQAGKQSFYRWPTSVWTEQVYITHQFFPMGPSLRAQKCNKRKLNTSTVSSIRLKKKKKKSQRGIAEKLIEI